MSGTVGLRDFGRILREAIEPREAQEMAATRGLPEGVGKRSETPRARRQLTTRQVEKQTGRTVARIIDRGDGSREFIFGDKAGKPAKDELDKWLERHPEYARPRTSPRH